MEFKQYPSYKNSGVEWLGEVPEHFNNIKLKQLAIGKLIYGANESAEYENKEHPRYIRITDIREDGTLNPGTFKSLPLEIAEQYLLSNNDILFARSGTVGKTFKYSNLWGICCFAGYLIKISINQKLANPDYIFYYLNSHAYWEYISSNQSQSTIKNVSAEKYANFTIAIPNLDEQNQITAFLDAETTRIDNLITKQEKLIKLLEEQRKSIISHAVTKGLNPDAPMKDSGVEWLGEVPEHWGLKRLDSISKIVRGNSTFAKGDLLDAGQYVALQYGKTYKVDEIDNSFNSYVNQEFFKSSQVAEFEDVVLISTSETLEDLGHSCFYARHDFGLIGGEQFLLKPNDQTFGKYLYYATKAFSSYLKRYATGLKVFRFNLDGLRKIYIPDIPLVNQQKIANFLDQETSRIDLLVSKQNNLIQKLKEYRSSIISHAVTGKIDVREMSV